MAPLLVAAPLALASPVVAQDAAGPGASSGVKAMPGDAHAGHDMGGMEMGAGQVATHDPHGAHPTKSMGAMDHDAAAAGMDEPEPGNTPAPPPPADHWADRYYPKPAMDAARAIARREHGGMLYSQIMFNLAEYQIRHGHDGYRWDGEAWFGGDIDRLTMKTEGEGTAHGKVDAAEVQALWSHAVDAYWNLQAGARLDIRPGPPRPYATIGVEGLAPYWFEVEGALFLSDKGDLLARAEAYHDQRLTQRLVLQPRIELNFAAQAIPANRVGSGLVDAELGLRLRYEIRREFAPYIGVSWEQKAGDTARFARADGGEASDASLVAGIRFWF